MLYWTHGLGKLWGWVRGARHQQLGAAETMILHGTTTQRNTVGPLSRSLSLRTATCMLYGTHGFPNLWGWVRGARRQQLGAAETTSARHRNTVGHPSHDHCRSEQIQGRQARIYKCGGQGYRHCTQGGQNMVSTGKSHGHRHPKSFLSQPDIESQRLPSDLKQLCFFRFLAVFCSSLLPATNNFGPVNLPFLFLFSSPNGPEGWVW